MTIMESSMRIRSNTSRSKLQSLTNMSSLASSRMHKIAGNVLNRSSTSMTLSPLNSTDPKFAVLASMAESVQRCDAFVSNSSKYLNQPAGIP